MSVQRLLLAGLTFLLLTTATACFALPWLPASEDGWIEVEPGLRLAHTVVGDQESRAPVILARTPYGRRRLISEMEKFEEAGFVVVLQDCRGTGESQGEWNPFHHEEEDGAATLRWIEAQEWCDGSVGTWGVSYIGVTQWQLAPHGGDLLDGMVLMFTSADVFRDLVHFGGVQSIAIGMSWALQMSGVTRPRFEALPLVEADDLAGKDIGYWNDWCNHYTLDDYWKPLDYADKYQAVTAPALLIAGWYDLFLPGQIDDYMQLSLRSGKPEDSFTRLIVGPWDHGGTGALVGRPDLGPQAYVAPTQEIDEFLACFVRGEDNGYQDRAGVRAFFLGTNEWRELDAWPPTTSKPVEFFFHSLGHAEDPSGGGLLTRRPPSRDEPADHFVYDPEAPAPSFATNLWVPLSSLADEREASARSDVLTYATLPLTEDLHVAGPVSCSLHIQSDAPDTDFAARLVEIRADDSMDWRAEGIQRARLRESVYRESPPLGNGVATLDVNLGHIACVFKKGTRIGLQVTSSNFPRFSRNLGTPAPSNLTKDPRKARQTVLHTIGHPSALKLHVLEGR